MLQRKAPAWIVIPVFAVVAVFIAGFFHDGARAEGAPRPASMSMPRKDASGRGFDLAESEIAFDPRAGSLAAAPSMKADFAVPANLFRRAGEIACRVESVVKTYESIDQRLKDFGGEITEMEITGNDDGRRGVLRCTVSTDKFNDCITYLRGIGKVLSERITASSRPKSRSRVPADGDDLDPRELSLVVIQVMDERSAREVSESSGLLATSFHRSASHGLAGLALIVEGLGWIAPYAFVALLIAAPFLVSRVIRRRAAVPAV